MVVVFAVVAFSVLIVPIVGLAELARVSRSDVLYGPAAGLGARWARRVCGMHSRGRYGADGWAGASPGRDGRAAARLEAPPWAG